MTLQQRGPVVIAGASGVLGRPLVERLSTAGYAVVVLSRSAGAQERATTRNGVKTMAWTPDGTAGPWAGVVDGAAAVINLAGASIAGERWNEARKQQILESRIASTRSLVTAIQAARQPPGVFISASGVGYYGACGDEPVTELTGPGKDFLANVCVQWEGEAMRAESDVTRVVTLRTGLVLARDGGALKEMLPPFWFGVGGPIGSGRQYWPWIHRRDWLALTQFALEQSGVSGAVNVTAPTPLPNREFAKALGRAVHRPALFPLPGFALRIIVGELADGLLTGQRALPAKATRAGFTFEFETLDEAFADLFAT